MYSTSIHLPESARRSSVEFLQARLCDAVDLMLQTKVAHWNVKGANFISLHLLFDEVNDRIRKIVDRIAERVTQLGGIATGDSSSVANHSSLPDYPLDISEGRDHIVALCRSMSEFGKSLKEGVAFMEELDDLGSSDLLVESVRTIDKYLWFVEAHVQDEKSWKPAETEVGPPKVNRAA
jgi:starvation-inducible DNA-binding protein